MFCEHMVYKYLTCIQGGTVESNLFTSAQLHIRVRLLAAVVHIECLYIKRFQNNTIALNSSLILIH